MTGVITGIAWAVGVMATLWGAGTLIVLICTPRDAYTNDRQFTKAVRRLFAGIAICAILAGACFGWLFGGGA